MILTKDDTFANGLGLELHIRTKLVRFWSYIKGTAIRIGDDILEIRGANFDGIYNIGACRRRCTEAEVLDVQIDTQAGVCGHEEFNVRP